MEQTYKEAVEKVAAWWTKVIQIPMNQDNGERGMMEILMNTVSMNAQKELTPRNIALFKENLVKELLANKDSYFHKTLSVDYHPDNVLSEVAQNSGIPLGVFPCKSSSYISKENVAKAGRGYQSGSHTI